MIIKVNYTVSNPIIKITYDETPIYVSTTSNPIYVSVNYGTGGGGSGTVTSVGLTMPTAFTVTSSPITTSGTIAVTGSGTTSEYVRGDGTLATFPTITSGTVTSVGLTMPSAFTVTSSPITTSGTIAVTGSGTTSQYVRGDGTLATLPSNTSGGSSVSYYLNGGTAASVATYYQMSNAAVLGTGVDFLKAGNGLISQFLTDVADPNRLLIPAGNWNFEMYMSASSSGGTPQFYVELLKYDGTTFTSIASSAANPESITGGTTIDLYITALAIPQTALLSTDRLAVRVYIVNSVGGRTITLHTQDSHLCEIITNFAGGVSALNGLTANTQYFAVGTGGTDFAISSATDTHTFNLPTASATNRGALSSADWTTFNSKFTLPSLTSGSVLFSDGTTISQNNASFFWDNTNSRLGLGTATPTFQIHATGSIRGNALFSATNLTVGATTAATTSSIVDIISTTKGVLFPRMTTTQKNAIATPAAGLMVFDTTLVKLCVYSGTAWETITSL